VAPDPLRFAVEGLGATGARCARQLVSAPAGGTVVLRDPEPGRALEVEQSLGGVAAADDGDPGDAVDAAVVILAGPVGTQLPAATAHLGRGTPVVCTSDDLTEVQALLALDAEARQRGSFVVVGAGFAPGLTDLLAVHGAARLDHVEEVHVAKVGTGGPACARQHHRSLRGESLDWRDGQWLRRPGGSGRELAWFPDPIGGRDCYRAELCDAALLVPALPGVQRVTARLAATRRDRFTSVLPMLRRPHADGGPGAVRVELRGPAGGAQDVVVLGAMDRPAVAAGAVAATAAVAVATGDVRRTGAGGVGEMFAPLGLLRSLDDAGIRCAIFEGGSQ